MLTRLVSSTVLRARALGKPTKVRQGRLEKASQEPVETVRRLQRREVSTTIDDVQRGTSDPVDDPLDR